MKSVLASVGAFVMAFGTVAGSEPLFNSAKAAENAVNVNPLKEAYYGDLHLHTTYSFDAYFMIGTKVDADTAYKFARGETVDYLGTPIKRGEPLDFMAVTDHGEYLGVFNQLEDPNSAFSKSETGEIAKQRNRDAIRKILSYTMTGKPLPGVDAQAMMAQTWKKIIDAANSNYQPGKFTTFIGYEYNPTPDGQNLHRNVIFKGDKAPPMPFSLIDSLNPEDLWKWMEVNRKKGFESLAITHNANASNGLMFDWTMTNGRPIDKKYAMLRIANEPLTEISQHKGTSETHPMLSPNDEFADFEIFDQLLMGNEKSKPPGSYVRDALGRGFVLQSKLGVNPYKLGIVGGTDLHSGLSDSIESEFSGKVGSPNLGAGRPTKEAASLTLDLRPDPSEWKGFKEIITSGPALTGIWAESNTRDSLYAGLRRRETFATSGTRLRFRFFGSWNFDSTLMSNADWIAKAYANGVPMGADLPARPTQDANAAPQFAVWGIKDPNSGNLDRVQVIKIWLDNGQQKEKVFDVVWSKGRDRDPVTGKVPPVGNTVNLKTGKYTNTIGAVELSAVWKDPEFNPDQPAAYYLRVLEIPTPRWSTLLAIQTGNSLPPNAKATIQERGWSSPIWYTPPQKKS